MNLKELKELKTNRFNNYNGFSCSGKIDFLGEGCFGKFYFTDERLESAWLMPTSILSKDYPDSETQEKKYQYWIRLLNAHFGEGVRSEDSIGRSIYWKADGCILATTAFNYGKAVGDGGKLHIAIKEAE